MKLLNIIIFSVILNLLVPISSFATDNWDKSEKILISTFVIGQIVNYGQVSYILSDPHWNELNPLITNRQSLVAIKLLGTGIVACISHLLPHKWRKATLIISNSIVWSCVVYDYSVGVKFNF